VGRDPELRGNLEIGELPAVTAAGEGYDFDDDVVGVRRVKSEE
jgi:hypothetical protein